MPLREPDRAALDWYLCRYPRFPYAPFRARAVAIEARLPAWGEQLWAALGRPRDPVIDAEDPSVPWELMGAAAGLVCRRVRAGALPPPVDRPLRVLWLRARPRHSALDPLDPDWSLDAARSALGEGAQLHLLDGRAGAQPAGPWDVVHIDAHGSLAPAGVVLEAPWLQDAEVVGAAGLGPLVRDASLLVLEGCFTAEGLAPTLAAAGLPRVIAMRGPVQARASRLFVHGLYSALVRGAGVGEAVEAGRATLRQRPERGPGLLGPWTLRDDSVPVLICSGDPREPLLSRPQGAPGPLPALPEPPLLRPRAARPRAAAADPLRAEAERLLADRDLLAAATAARRALAQALARGDARAASAADLLHARISLAAGNRSAAADDLNRVARGRDPEAWPEGRVEALLWLADARDDDLQREDALREALCLCCAHGLDPAPTRARLRLPPAQRAAPGPLNQEGSVRWS